MIDLETRFTRSASDRLAREMPDVEALIDSATIAGTRIKRRRYAGASALAAATAAAVVTGVVLLTPGVTTAPAPPGFASNATQEAAEPELTIETFSYGGGVGEALLATYGDHRVLFARQSLDPPEGKVAPSDLPIALFGPTDALPEEVVRLLGEYDRLIPGIAPPQMRDAFPAITDWSEFSSVESPGYRQGSEVVFTIDAPEGWECSQPGDEKAGCAHGDALVSVIQRDAATHDDWATSPDKGGPGTGVLVSEVYGDHFVSIQGSNATADQVHEIADALTWQDGTPVSFP